MHKNRSTQVLERRTWTSYVTAIFLSLMFVVLAVGASTFISYRTIVHADISATIGVWWPSESVPVSGVQPFKAVAEGLAVEQYEMFWQVDGGQWNWMDNNYSDYPHKEARVDLSGWSWRGSGPYMVNFIVRKGGVVLAQKQVAIRLNTTQTAPQISEPHTQSQPVATQTQAAPVSTLTLAPVAKVATLETQSSLANTAVSSSGLYVEPNTPAAMQASQWRASRPADAALMDVLAAQPTVKWLGNWNSDVQADVKKVLTAAAAQNKTASFVLYNIPARDCGGYSAGGTSVDAYLNWVRNIVAGIGSGAALVLLEPDAIAGISCLSAADQQTRLSLIRSTVDILKANPKTKVYLDAGHSGWLDATTMASRLTQANIAKADGFFLNVSNFKTTSDETTYGTAISKQLGGKHFVIDTSRNGNGPDGDNWCNPPGRAIGQKPTTATGNPLIDAYLWVKTPGESDGSCNGAPGAGQWWADYALGLVKNAKQ